MLKDKNEKIHLIQWIQGTLSFSGQAKVTQTSCMWKVY